MARGTTRPRERQVAPVTWRSPPVLRRRLAPRAPRAFDRRARSSAFENAGRGSVSDVFHPVEPTPPDQLRAAAADRDHELTSDDCASVPPAPPATPRVIDRRARRRTTEPARETPAASSPAPAPVAIRQRARTVVDSRRRRRGRSARARTGEKRKARTRIAESAHHERPPGTPRG